MRGGWEMEKRRNKAVSLKAASGAPSVTKPGLFGAALVLVVGLAMHSMSRPAAAPSSGESPVFRESPLLPPWLLAVLKVPPSLPLPPE